MPTPHPIYGFVGPSGCGKSTLIWELTMIFPRLRIVKSTTTRPQRDQDDQNFYDFASVPQFRHLVRAGEFINYQHYAGYWYGTRRTKTLELLADSAGLMAMVEGSIPAVRRAGITVKLIRVEPLETAKDARTIERQEDDAARARIPLAYELTVRNSFQDGGLRRSIHQLVKYFGRELFLY